MLDKLWLIVQERFQFLNALGFCLKDKVMFSTWQCDEIDDSVIILDTIKMVNDITIRQGFLMIALPDKNMFLNITLIICSRMVFVLHHNITRFVFESTSSPTRMGSMEQILFHSTTMTPFCLCYNWFPAIFTRMHTFVMESITRCFSPTLPNRSFITPATDTKTCLASLTFASYQDTTVHTRMLVFCLIPALIYCIIHILIVPQMNTYKKRDDFMDELIIKEKLKEGIGE